MVGNDTESKRNQTFMKKSPNRLGSNVDHKEVIGRETNPT